MSEEAPIAFGLGGWCRLVAHDCDGLEGRCPCECHKPRAVPRIRAYPRRSGAE